MRWLARNWWVFISLVPLGLGAWAPVVPGVRDGVKWWTAAGVFWSAVTVAAFVAVGSESTAHDTLAGVLLLLAWVGGAVTSIVILGLSRARRRSALTAAAPSSSAAGPYPPTPGAQPYAPRPIPVAPGAEPYVPRPIPVQPGAAPSAPHSIPPRRDYWPWVSLAPIGFGSWAPIVAAVRCRVWWWAAPGLAGVVTTVSGFVLAVSASARGGAHHTEAALAGLLWMAAWVGGIIVSFAIRPAYDAKRGFPGSMPAWPQPTTRSASWPAAYGVIALVGAFAVLVVVGIALDLAGVNITVGEGGLLVDAIFLLWLVPLARRRGLSLKDLGVRPTRPVRSLGFVIQAFLAYVVLAGLWSLVFLSHVSAKSAAGALSQAGHLGTFQTVLVVIAVSVVAPTVEEIFFRGLLYRSLRNRLGVPQAALIAGCLFGLAHIGSYPLITLPIRGIFGVIACLLYERTGSLLPGIALHSFVDASAIEVALTGNDDIVLIVAGAVILVLLGRAASRNDISPPVATSAGEVSGGSLTG